MKRGRESEKEADKYVTVIISQETTQRPGEKIPASHGLFSTWWLAAAVTCRVCRLN